MSNGNPCCASDFAPCSFGKLLADHILRSYCRSLRTASRSSKSPYFGPGGFSRQKCCSNGRPMARPAPDQVRGARGCGGRGDVALLRLPRAALAADPHQQSARVNSARNQSAHRCGGEFLDGQSALSLTAAKLRHIADTAWSSKRHLNIALRKDQQLKSAIIA